MRAAPAILLTLALAACDGSQPLVQRRTREPGPFPAADRPVATIVSSRWSTEEARDRVDEAGRVMELADIRPGQTVADIGAGEGYYTVRLAGRVGPKGRVVGQDIVSAVRDRLAERVARERLQNVSVRLGEPADPKLPAASFDRVMMVLNQIVMSVPSFFTGILFTYVFGLILKFFTPTDFVSYTEDPSAFWGFLVFPALSIALPKAAMVIKLLRGSMVREMSEDYVRTAYSRGNSRWQVLKGHVMRNAMVPVVTFLAFTLVDIIAGSIIIEQVFNIPGMGRLLMTSINGRDLPVVQTIIMIISLVVITVNYIADISYKYIDPRIRFR